MGRVAKSLTRSRSGKPQRKVGEGIQRWQEEKLLNNSKGKMVHFAQETYT